MQLIVHLQTTADKVDTSTNSAVRVVELQRVDGQIDHFDGLPIDEGQPDTFEIEAEGQCWSNLFTNSLEGLLTATCRILLRDRDGVSACRFVQADLRVVVGDADDLLARLCPYVQRDRPRALPTLQGPLMQRTTQARSYAQ